jgi:CheY-like chemotaxis protein
VKTSETQHEILFVDDDPDFLQMLSEMLATFGQGRWQVHRAGSVDAALEILKHQKIDLVVVDLSMPVLDGIQFLHLLNERFPGLKKVTLTGYATEERRTECLANGAELFIEKPKTAEGFKSVFAMLDDLISWLPREGFQGMLRRVGLSDVIQMECLGRNSSVLEVYNEHVLGRIYIENGSIIHAAGGELVGERALQRLLALPGGSFELVPFEPPQENTINGPWEFLLMEAARLRDENAAQIAPGEPEVDPKTLAAPTDATVQVEETLICSGKGEPTYEFQCADAQSRVLLLQNIAHHAAQLAQILPLGNFDRLEMQLAGERIVAQTRPDRLVYVRLTGSPTAA